MSCKAYAWVPVKIEVETQNDDFEEATNKIAEIIDRLPREIVSVDCHWEVEWEDDDGKV